MAIGYDDDWSRDVSRVARDWSDPRKTPPPIKEKTKVIHVVLFALLSATFGWLASLVFPLLTHSS